jgi:hypothetical protein
MPKRQARDVGMDRMCGGNTNHSGNPWNQVLRDAHRREWSDRADLTWVHMCARSF